MGRNRQEGGQLVGEGGLVKEEAEGSCYLPLVPAREAPGDHTSSQKQVQLSALGSIEGQDACLSLQRKAFSEKTGSGQHMIDGVEDPRNRGIGMFSCPQGRDHRPTPAATLYRHASVVPPG